MTNLPQVQQQETLPAVSAPRSTMDMVSDALSRGAPMEMVERLLALHERWESQQAKKAFIEAKAAFKAEVPAIIKDRENSQYKSKYTSIGNLVTTVNEALSKHGLDASWTYDQSDKIKVTCKLQHVLGYSESVSMIAPPDTTGQKNPIQQIKSATTYLRVATYEAVTGIASNDEANMNDDGNAAYEKRAPANSASKDPDKILIDFDAGRNPQMESIHFKEILPRSLAFIDSLAGSPDTLEAWYVRNRDGIRQLHSKDKAAKIAIGRKLDEVVSAARKKIEAPAEAA